jgi:hypothetical protein
LATPSTTVIVGATSVVVVGITAVLIHRMHKHDQQLISEAMQQQMQMQQQADEQRRIEQLHRGIKAARQEAEQHRAPSQMQAELNWALRRSGGLGLRRVNWHGVERQHELAWRR